MPRSPRRTTTAALLVAVTALAGCSSDDAPAAATLSLRDSMTSTSYGTYKDGADLFAEGSAGQKKFDVQLLAMKVNFETNNVAQKKVLSTGAKGFEYCGLGDDGTCNFYRRVEVQLSDDGSEITDFTLWEGVDTASATEVSWALGSEQMQQGDSYIAELNNSFTIGVLAARSRAGNTCIYVRAENLGGGILDAYPSSWGVRTVDDLELEPTSWSDPIDLTEIGAEKTAEVCFDAPLDDIAGLVLPASSVAYDYSNFADAMTIAADWDII